MEKFQIHGGIPLRGTVEISGMKNAALPIIFACVLVKDKCVIENVPNVSDVLVSLDILSKMGARIRRLARNTVEIDCTDVEINDGMAGYDMFRKLRASYYLLGAELGRFGRARVGFPGGCDFGTGARPIDQHIKCFEAMGCTVNTDGGFIDISSSHGAKASNIFFDIVSVGATVNAMLAAVLNRGVTTIDNPAKEPHIVDLANFLNTCGAKISGAGTDMIKIRGVERLHGCNYTIIPDMIEAGTFMIAAAATAGHVTVTNIIPKHVESITAKLLEIGVDVKEFDDYVVVSGNGNYDRTSLKTLPYPGFPTDMQPQMTALLCLSQGVSYVSEGVYENRFRYVGELTRMGASIKVDGRTAVIEGGAPMSGAQVRAVDLRAGVALVIAGLACGGTTEISDIHLIDRGYDGLEGKLKALGADFRRIILPDNTTEAIAN